MPARPARSNGREASGRLDAGVVADSLLKLYNELAPGLNRQASFRKATHENSRLPAKSSNAAPDSSRNS